MFFRAKIGYLGRPRAMGRYSALEPAYYCFELIEMLAGYPVQVDISGHGLRERGPGSPSSNISFSLPQCGHFSFLPASVRGSVRFWLVGLVQKIR